MILSEEVEQAMEVLSEPMIAVFQKRDADLSDFKEFRKSGAGD